MLDDVAALVVLLLGHCWCHCWCHWSGHWSCHPVEGPCQWSVMCSPTSATLGPHRVGIKHLFDRVSGGARAWSSSARSGRGVADVLDIVQTFDVQVFDPKPSGAAADGTWEKRTDRRHTMSTPTLSTPTASSLTVSAPTVSAPTMGAPRMAARSATRSLPGTRSRGVDGSRPAHLVLVPTVFEAPVPPMPAGLRLTARGRAVVVLLAAGLALGGVLSAQSAAAGGPQGAVPVSAHVVQPGDTVWGIAAAVAAPGQDVRDVVATIEQLNGLDGGAIVAGQRLVVPEG